MAAALRLKAIRNLQRISGGALVNVRGGNSVHQCRAFTNGFPLHERVVSSSFYNFRAFHPLNHTFGNMERRLPSMVLQTPHIFVEKRLASTQVKPPTNNRQQLQGSLGVVLSSPGFVYEPYAPRERLPFWQRWFTKLGWKRLKEDVILEFRSAYAIQKLRKTGYSKNKFYKEATELYKEISKALADGEKADLRKLVTEKMFSELKNDIKQRESKWSSIYFEIFEPIKVRTLRARAIGVDRNDLEKVFVQVTLEFLSKQKFEAYNAGGSVVSGDKNKEVLVRDIWVFEKSLFHPKSYWRLCGRIMV